MRKAIAAPWVSSLFTATNRIVGRRAASQIASASTASFFCHLTKGFTQAGGISRTSCSSFPISRPQNRRSAKRNALRRRLPWQRRSAAAG